MQQSCFNQSIYITGYRTKEKDAYGLLGFDEAGKSIFDFAIDHEAHLAKFVRWPSNQGREIEWLFQTLENLCAFFNLFGRAKCWLKFHRQKG